MMKREYLGRFLLSNIDRGLLAAACAGTQLAGHRSLIHSRGLDPHSAHAVDRRRSASAGFFPPS